MLINSASEKERLWISLKKWYLLNNNVYCSWIFKKTEIFWSLQMNIFIEVENGNFDLSPLLDDGTTLLHSDWSPWLNAGSLLAVRSKRENLIKLHFKMLTFTNNFYFLHKVSRPFLLLLWDDWICQTIHIVLFATYITTYKCNF